MPLQCSFLAIAEFNISHGNCLVVLQPNLDEFIVNTESIADKMLCDGGEKHARITTWFSVQLRKKSGEMKHVYCLSVMGTFKDTTAPRGAVTRAICAAVENANHIAVVEPILTYMAAHILTTQSSTSMYASLSERDEAWDAYTLGIYQALQEAVNNLPTSFPSDESLAHSIARRCFRSKKRPRLLTTVKLRDTSLSISVPLGLDKAYVNLPGSLHSNKIHLNQEWCEPLMIATLTKKKVIFVSSKYSRADYVVTAIARLLNFISKALFDAVDILPGRVFPYCTLYTMQAEVNTTSRVGTDEGYVIGVTNPLFVSKTSWWDVLVDLDTKEMKVNEAMCPIPRELCVNAAFPVLSYIILNSERCHDTELMQKFHYLTVLSYCQEWLASVKLNPLRYEVMEAWFEVAYIIQVPYTSDSTKDVLDDRDHILAASLQKLLKLLQKDEAVLNLLSFFERSDDDDLLGSLFPIAALILHSKEIVRLLATTILRRIDQHKIGTVLINELTDFVLLAFEQTRQTMPELSP